MTYNEQLQSNNTDLQALLDAVEALPEAKPDPVLQNKTVTPGTADQTVTADSGYDGLGTVTVQGDADLKAANIASGVSIFGVTGSLQAGAKVATGTLSMINAGKTITIQPGFVPKTILIVSIVLEATPPHRVEYANGKGIHYMPYYDYDKYRYQKINVTMSATKDQTTITSTSDFRKGDYTWMAAS